MEYWKPNIPQPLGAALQASPGGSNYQEPKMQLPNVGDTILLAITNWGGVNIVDTTMQVMASGAEYVEVEVKAIRKATVTLN